MVCCIGHTPEDTCTSGHKACHFYTQIPRLLVTVLKDKSDSDLEGDISSMYILGFTYANC